MPQLDRLLPRLESGAASQIILEADAPIRCLTPSGPVAVSRDALTRPQLLALVAELAEPTERSAIIAGADAVRFLYQWNGQRWLVARDAESEGTRVAIRRWVDKPDPVSTANGRVDAPVPQVPASPTAASGGAVASPAVERRSSLGHGGAPPEHRHRRASDRPLGPYESAADAQRALDELLRTQVSRGAADLHLRAGEPPILRVGGDLQRIDGLPALTSEQIFGMLWSVMPDRNRAEYDTAWDTDFAHEIEGVSRFRVNVLKDRNGAAAVIRTIAAGTVTVEEMGITPEVQQLCALTKGLVLVTGPTGSGKSTTLCALVDLINRTRSDHIITIEDPIEFVHTSKRCLITQRQVGVHTQSFKSALRAALREDPDIVLVGELRDLETIAIALETAETGHLVFGTLHTSTAAGTINRIVDQFPADRQDQIRVMLSESLKGVISQTLCRRIGGGRVAAREILLVNKAVSALIREGKTVQIPNIIQTQKKLGMEMLNDALLQLVRSNTVEPAEAYVKSAEKKDMAAKLKALGYDLGPLVSEE
jgi:twitching motility protein PilT